MGLRIIGGCARGRRLRSPPGGRVRPTGERVREALFNIWGQHFEGVHLLEVCAGSGAVSLEALSRGAAGVVALERDAVLCRHIWEEAQRAGLAEGLEVRRGDALAELRRLRREGTSLFEMAFVDPPWREGRLRQEILDLLFEETPLCRSAVVECPRGAEEPEAPAGGRLVRRARYGRTTLLFFEAVSLAGDAA